MIEIEIQDTGERLVMSKKDRLRVTFQSCDLRESGTSTSSFSTSAKIPLTAENIERLGFRSVMSIQPSEVTIIKARLLSGNNELDKGFIRLNEVSKDKKELDITFFGRNVDWFSQLKGKDIRDIDLSIYDHLNTAANINTNRDSGYIYLPVDYGTLAVKSSATILQSEIFPAVFVKTVIQHIFKDIGYKVRGTLFENPRLQRMLIPFSGIEPVHSKEWVNERTVKLTGDGSGTYGDYYAFTVTTTEQRIPLDKFVQNSVFDPNNGNYNPNTYEYRVDTPMDIQVVVDATFDTETINFIQVYKNGVSQATFYGLQNASGSVYLSNLVEGDTIYFTVLKGGIGYSRLLLYNYTTDVGSERIGNYGSIEVIKGSTSTFAILAQKRLAQGSLYNIGWFLPKMKQSELIEYIFFVFGALVSFDSRTNSIVIDTINDLAISNSEDWSSKLDLSKPIDKDLFDFVSDYAKKNTCKYSREEYDTPVEDYLNDYGEEYGQGSIDINNEYLESEKEYYTAPFLPSKSIEVFTGVANLQMYLPFLFQKDNGKAYIMYYCPNVSVSELTNGVISTVTIAGTAQTHIPYPYFVTPINYINDPLINDQLCFDLPIDYPYNGNGILESNYRSISKALNKSEVVTASIFLTALEIANISFTTLKYIEPLGGYFYLNKIGQYNDSGDSTECELIKWY